jgi:hypothetical protein
MLICRVCGIWSRGVASLVYLILEICLDDHYEISAAFTGGSRLGGGALTQ